MLQFGCSSGGSSNNEIGALTDLPRVWLLGPDSCKWTLPVIQHRSCFLLLVCAGLDGLGSCCALSRKQELVGMFVRGRLLSLPGSGLTAPRVWICPGGE